MRTASPVNSAFVETRDQWHAMLELAAFEVFEVMLGSRLERAEGVTPEEPAEFTAMVGLAGALCGVISLRCSSAAAGRIASRMLGVSAEEAEAQTRDAIGEVCNMVGGTFKTKLAGAGSQCLLSVPTVITGADYQLHSLAEGGTVEVMLAFEGSTLRFSLEVTGTM